MEQPNFYAIIPANIRYDKRLKANEKLLYGEITSLANVKGYCYAGNNYFAGLYDVSVETVSRWVSSLGKFGYITVIVDEKTNRDRKIYISQVPESEPDTMTKTSTYHDENVNVDHDENVKHNNTSINNKNNIFDFWNSKGIIIHKKISSDFEKIINTAIKKYGVENIMLAIERYSQAYFDTNFYYNNRWTLLNFLKQGNGISNWLDDGQIWNNYSPVAAPTKKQTAAIPGAEQTSDYLDRIRDQLERGVSRE